MHCYETKCTNYIHGCDNNCKKFINIDCCNVVKLEQNPKTVSEERPRLNDLLCCKPGTHCEYVAFYRNVKRLTCGEISFMNKGELYDAIKKEWDKVDT